MNEYSEDKDGWVVCGPSDPEFVVKVDQGRSFVALDGCCTPVDPAVASLIFPVKHGNDFGF